MSNTEKDIRDYCELIQKLLPPNLIGNNYYIYRELLMSREVLKESNGPIHIVEEILFVIEQGLPNWQSQALVTTNFYIENPNCVISITKYLEEIKRSLQTKLNDLYIINIAPVNTINAPDISHVLDHERLSRIFQEPEFIGSTSGLIVPMITEQIGYVKETYQIFDDAGISLIIGKDADNNLNIVKENIHGSVSLIRLDEGLMNYLTNTTNRCTMNVRSFKNKSRIEKILTEDVFKRFITLEGLKVDEHGNIKISLANKHSYMDSYAENHKLIKENWKNKNYEGVKSNLVTVFALISTIEKDKGFKEKDNDIIKARAFAINDFKTYLKKIQSVEKDFDFSRYYIDSGADSTTIDIPVSTVVGVKRLLKIILM